MFDARTAAIVLAAGMGTRMKSSLPKVLHPLGGRPMIAHLLETVDALAPDQVVVVIGPNMEDVAKACAPHATVVQAERRGTAHAVAQAKAHLENFDGDVFILYGDTPLITLETLIMMQAARAQEPFPSVVVLGFRPEDPAEYGRLLATHDGMLDAIIEYKDASDAERELDLCNSGVMCVDGKDLFALIDQVKCDNAKNEYYLTDIVALARRKGLMCAVVESGEEELMGINSRDQLAEAEAVFQWRKRFEVMEEGATLLDPGSVHFSWDTRLGQDVTIGPFVVFGPGVEVQDGVTIKGFCHLEGARVATGAIVGPYARLRPGADIAEDAHIGNFVEIKNAFVEQGAKVNHLSYIGDGRVGASSNIGAGTIFCNYDGYTKSHTDIGRGVFIGSNTALVAPVTVGDRAVVGAGSVITRDVPADALAVARGRQDMREGWAKTYHTTRAAAKAAKKGKS